MEGIKSCAFTSRQVTFHEQFVPLGDKSKKTFPKQTMAILWHKAIAGRAAGEISSAYVKAITELSEDASDIIIWLDNCSAQNENWYLYTTMARILNDKSLPNLESVTFKYL